MSKDPAIRRPTDALSSASRVLLAAVRGAIAGAVGIAASEFVAGVVPGAQIVGRSVDGFTAGLPTAWALDPSREPMIAVGMNRAVLPGAHGYPARLIVPGLYGYVSATKWLSEIELTTREAFDGYWIPLAWAKDGPILTESRIDHPSDGAKLALGQVDIDGVAWAPDRGVKLAEVRIDDGPWQQALLSRESPRRPGCNGGSAGRRRRAGTPFKSEPPMELAPLRPPR